MESPPLARLLHSLGKVQHHLHTVVVGLSAVENQIAEKPSNLDIAWDPKDPVGSAREARRFLLRATIIFAAEGLKEYADRVLEYRSLSTGVQAPLGDRASRIRALAKPDEIDPPYLSVAPLIVSNWRNRIVHRNSTAGLTVAEHQRLAGQSRPISENFKGVDIARLLRDSELDQPTLKDVTVLLAMSIRFARQVDSKLPEATAPEQIRLWVQAENLLGEVLRIEKEAANGGNRDPRQRGRQYLLTKAPGLAASYYEHGILARLEMRTEFRGRMSAKLLVYASIPIFVIWASFGDGRDNS